VPAEARGELVSQSRQNACLTTPLENGEDGSPFAGPRLSPKQCGWWSTLEGLLENHDDERLSAGIPEALVVPNEHFGKAHETVVACQNNAIRL
jgi:hypothetical protein